jgi:hypothetical protein
LPLQEAAWAVSNIAAGSILQKHTVFNGGVVPPLLHLLATAVFDVRKESAYCLGNLCVAPKESREQGGIILEHLIALVDSGCLPGFIALVRSPDVEFYSSDKERQGLPKGSLLLVLSGLYYAMGGASKTLFIASEYRDSSPNLRSPKRSFGPGYGSWPPVLLKRGWPKTEHRTDDLRGTRWLFIPTS